MSPELLSFMQTRMSTAYQEQVWAVALVGALNAFVAINGRKLRNAIWPWLIHSAVVVVSALALAFVWSRHIIYVHYDDCAKLMLSEASRTVCGPSWASPAGAWLARWSGVTLYSLIIVGLLVTAIRLVATSDEKAGA